MMAPPNAPPDLRRDPVAALAAVRDVIAAACRETGRDPAGVTVVAVSKTFDAGAIEPVIAAGQAVFGENRVQEAGGKWPPLLQRHAGAGLKLHMIGPPHGWRDGSRQLGRQNILASQGSAAVEAANKASEARWK
jgi:PLP dependent protein